MFFFFGIPIEPRKNTSYFPLYWLVKKDPCNGLLKSPHNWVVSSPIYPKQPGFLSIAQLGVDVVNCILYEKHKFRRSL